MTPEPQESKEVVKITHYQPGDIVVKGIGHGGELDMVIVGSLGQNFPFRPCWSDSAKQRKT